LFSSLSKKKNSIKQMNTLRFMGRGKVYENNCSAADVNREQTGCLFMQKLRAISPLNNNVSWFLIPSQTCTKQGGSGIENSFTIKEGGSRLCIIK
jgi:hypothetical protein